MSSDTEPEALAQEGKRGIRQWEAEQSLQERREFYRSAIGWGTFALKSLFAINGGAAVALLALAGHIIGSSAPEAPLVEKIVPAIFWFCGGLVAAVAAAAVAYVADLLGHASVPGPAIEGHYLANPRAAALNPTSMTPYHEGMFKHAQRLSWTGLCLGVLSLGLFIGGVVSAGLALKDWQPKQGAGEVRLPASEP